MTHLIIFSILFVLALGFWLGVVIFNIIRVMFGYKLYEYTKILSYGMGTEKRWCRNDEEALTYFKHFEFVEEIRPNKRRIKPEK